MKDFLDRLDKMVNLLDSIDKKLDILVKERLSQRSHDRYVPPPVYGPLPNPYAPKDDGLVNPNNPLHNITCEVETELKERLQGLFGDGTDE
jgi:hypothetical protein